MLGKSQAKLPSTSLCKECQRKMIGEYNWGSRRQQATSLVTSPPGRDLHKQLFLFTYRSPEDVRTKSIDEKLKPCPDERPLLKNNYPQLIIEVSYKRKGILRSRESDLIKTMGNWRIISQT